MSDTIDAVQAAKDVLRVLNRHNIPITGIDYIFELAKELVCKNATAQSWKGENHV